MRRLLKPWLLGITLAITPVVVYAQQQPAQPKLKHYPACTTKPTEADVSGAKGAFQAGQASFNEGDYKTAITYWEDAFHRDCTAVALLLNLGRAYELNGQKAAAVNALQAYIKRKPNSPQIDQIQKRIQVLEQKIAKQKAKAASTAPAASGSAGAATTAPGSSAPPPTTTGGKRPILPLIVAGAGGVVGLTGLIGFLVENGKYNDVLSKCPNKTCTTPAEKNHYQPLAYKYNTGRNVFGAIGIVGGVVAVGGVVWYFLSPPQTTSSGRAASKRHTAVVPELGPGYAGLSLSGAF